MLNAFPNGLILELAAESRRGNLARVNELLENPAVRDNAVAYDNLALHRATSNGHLTIINRLLEIPAVIGNAETADNLALRMAAENDHLAVVNRLLEIPAVRDNAAAGDNYVLGWAAENGHLEVVNSLLEIPAVRDNAAAEENYALLWAARAGYLEVVCSLLNTPNVCSYLENDDRENFLDFYKSILREINKRTLTEVQNDEGSIIEKLRSRGPSDAEIKIVDILRDIGSRHGISTVDFTEEELNVLEFARHVNDSLYFKLSTNTSFMAELLAAPAPQPEPLPLFDPAAPASSSGTPALLEDDALPSEVMEQPVKRQRVLGSLFDCFCRRRDADFDIESGPGEPSSSRSNKRARRD